MQVCGGKGEAEDQLTFAPVSQESGQAAGDRKQC